MVTLTGVNDGTNTRPVSISMGICVGDTNADRTDNSGDAIETRNRSGQLAGQTNVRSDMNADGTVNSGDAAICANKIRRHRRAVMRPYNRNVAVSLYETRRGCSMEAARRVDHRATATLQPASCMS